jgi:hypothetical protein
MWSASLTAAGGVRPKITRQGARGGIVLSYLNSCVRETISGGTVTVGTDQSEVQGGERH